MIQEPFIFLAGHHRSGTSLLHQILRAHPEISGFHGTGVPEDEGQHLQTVFEPARTFGGPGKYIFDPNSRMDETRVLATAESASTIFNQWQQHYDAGCAYYIEKSPPNLVRTRFLQALFPNSRFVVMFRHPLPVSIATEKWSGTTWEQLVQHTLLGYEIFVRDMPKLNRVFVLRYEDFVSDPQNEIDRIYEFLELEPVPIGRVVTTGLNDVYFSRWERRKQEVLDGPAGMVGDELERRANRLGYSIFRYRERLPCPLLGPHERWVEPFA